MQLTGGISKGLAMLTLDQDYISRFRNQPMTLQQRLIYALQALGVGLYEGVIGQPTFCQDAVSCSVSAVSCHISVQHVSAVRAFAALSAQVFSLRLSDLAS